MLDVLTVWAARNKLGYRQGMHEVLATIWWALERAPSGQGWHGGARRGKQAAQEQEREKEQAKAKAKAKAEAKAKAKANANKAQAQAEAEAETETEAEAEAETEEETTEGAAAADFDAADDDESAEPVAAFCARSASTPPVAMRGRDGTGDDGRFFGTVAGGNAGLAGHGTFD